MTGWLCGFTWQTGIAGCSFIAGTLLQGLFVLNIPTYDYHRWHGSLLTLAFMFFSVIFNTFLARRLPLVESILVWCHILGVIIFIPLIALSKKTEGQPIIDFYDASGWSSNGVATLVGISGPITSLIGFDCSIHMSTLIHCLDPSDSRRRGNQGLFADGPRYSARRIHHQRSPWIFRSHGHHIHGRAAGNGA
jgi:amino acid transporter